MEKSNIKQKKNKTENYFLDKVDHMIPGFYISDLIEDNTFILKVVKIK